MSALIPGITINFDAQALVIQSQGNLTALSSAVVGGGLRRTRWVVVQHVPKKNNQPRHAQGLKTFAAQRGIEPPFIGLLTAANLEKTQIAQLSEDGLTVNVVITAGISNAACAAPLASCLSHAFEINQRYCAQGSPEGSPRGAARSRLAGISLPLGSASAPAERTGTINIILLVDGKLSSTAMVNAVITATEAKTAVLRQHDVKCPDGHFPTGASTDAIVVAVTGKGKYFEYAGPATLVGWLLARGGHQALGEILV